MLRAKKRENGSMPSLAISCFTDTEISISADFAADIMLKITYLARL